jgi:hypothetical protein
MTSIKVIQGHLRKARFFKAVQAFEASTSKIKESPVACYLAAFAWTRLHRYDRAKPLLRQAIAENFNGYSGWTSTKAFLKNIATIEKLTPPLLAQVTENGATPVRLFAEQTPWTRPIMKALPVFVQRARQAFGSDVPPISFYIFKTRSSFETIFRLVFNAEIRHSWQDGTGNYNIVVFCERDRTGKISRKAAIACSTGDVLHEYGHALCTTIYGDRYLHRVPQWLNEGMADAIARPYYDELFGRADYFLKQFATKKMRPPSYEQMCTDMYSDPGVGYIIARAMVAELVKNDDLSVLGAIIRRARQLKNFERAVELATGISPRTCYNRVIKRYWHRKSARSSGKRR